MEEPQLSQQPSDPMTEQWREMLTGTHPNVVRLRRIHSHLPASPRCKFCLAPFGGIGGAIMRPLGFKPWDGNPNLCTNCFKGLRTRGIGGAEVPATIFFADVRNSTTLAEGMSPAEFSQLMQRFYVVASAELADHLAIIDKFVGDGVIGLFVPGLTGTEHAQRAIEAGRGLLRRLEDGSADGPWLPVGIGINTGVTFVGTVGVGSEVKDITALGDPVNTAARLSGAAAAGEILIAETTAQSAGIDARALEHRELQLKGKTDLVGAYVLHATDVTPQGVAA